MKKCKYCNVTVETEKDFCPLCFNHLETIDNDVEPFYRLRKKNETAIITNRFLYKLFSFISLCVVSICFIIDYLTSETINWSLVVLFSVLYVWVLIAYTIISKRSVFKKVFLQLISIFLLLFFIQKLSAIDWFLTYVFPSVSILAVSVTLMLIFIKKNRGEYVIGFLFIHLLLAIASLLILLIKKDTFFLLNMINAIFCFLSFLGILIFGFNALKSELQKKWHL